MIVPVTLTVEGAGMPFFAGVAGGLSFVSGSGFSPAPQNVQTQQCRHWGAELDSGGEHV